MKTKSRDDQASASRKPDKNTGTASGGSVLLRVGALLGRRKSLLLLSIVLSAAGVIFSLYVPILFGKAIDVIAEQGISFDILLGFLAQAAVVVVVAAIAQWAAGVVNNKLTFETVQLVRKLAFDKIEILPLKYIDQTPHGDLVSRVIADADTFADGLLMGFTQFFSGITTIVATLIFMLCINPVVTLVAAILTPMSLLVARFIAKHTHSLFAEQSKIRGGQTALIDEMIGGAKVVAAYGYRDRSLERFDKINRDLEVTSRRAIFLSSLVNPVTRFVNAIVYAAVCLTGAFMVIGGAMTVGGLSAILSYATQYTKPFNEISGVIAELQNAIACAARIFELIDAEPQSSDEGFDELKDIDGNVKIKHLRFSYSPDRPLIKDLNLNVRSGQRVAIVGPTGCGKTTLINLLMRFYDAQGGEIIIDGKNTAEVTRASLRSGFGMVLQDTWLRSGTIRDNIVLGKPDATDEEIIAAAKATHAHSFIKRLPQGYDTMVTEDGGNLSAGQKQLLCITRVMLCAPPMLILDEATSSIDTKTELRVQRAFEKLMTGKTSFIVAHRLSTIMSADVILVMRDGDVIEQGTHAELMRKGGAYAELYNSQFAH